MAKKTKKPYVPKWLLSEDWGVDMDRRQWKLYGAVRSPTTGKVTEWRIRTYHSSLDRLLRSLHQQICLQETIGLTLVEHITQAHETWLKCVAEADLTVKQSKATCNHELLEEEDDE